MPQAVRRAMTRYCAKRSWTYVPCPWRPRPRLQLSKALPGPRAPPNVLHAWSKSGPETSSLTLTSLLDRLLVVQFVEPTMKTPALLSPSKRTRIVLLCWAPKCPWGLRPHRRQMGGCALPLACADLHAPGR